MSSNVKTPPLGNNGKSSSPLKPKTDYLSLKMNRTVRFLMQKNAQTIFYNEGVKAGLEHPQNFHETAKCYRTPFSSNVAVNVSPEHQTAFYNGVITCGRVWTCPVCSAKIQERRREEIAQAMRKTSSEKLKCIMVTFTFPHTEFDDLKSMLHKQAAAFKYLRSGKAWTKAKKNAGYIGLIRSLETTIGRNGWHPHTHELWFVDKDCDAEELRETVVSRWATSCERNGLLPENKREAFLLRSVDVQDNATCSDYLAKFDNTSHWGADREIAKASTKRSKGLHPFELLADSVVGYSRKKRIELWLEYSEAMKGKRQLYWSQGLKKWAGVQEKSDEEIAQEDREDALLIGLLDRAEWKIIVDRTAQAEILYRAETGGWKKVEEWLERWQE